MKDTYSDLHVIITGGAGFLGTAVTGLLLEAGARCSIPCYNESKAASFAYRNHDEVFVQAGIDLTEEDQASAFYQAAVAANGPLWASVNLAGGFGMSDIAQTSAAEFMKQFKWNLLTCFTCSRAAVGHIRQTGKGGRIVNVAARPALEPRQGAGMTAYTAAKAGVAAFTEALAAELAGEDILVNAIAPSIIDTPANRKSMPGADYEKWPKPNDLARQIAWLASTSNSVTRGTVAKVYGKS